MNNINSKLKQLVIAILVTQGVAFTATAADVPISPIITGSAGGYSEAPGNFWFSVDNTCSMYFWTQYDNNITYTLPVKPNGSTMPMPTSNDFDSTDPFLAISGVSVDAGSCGNWLNNVYAGERTYNDGQQVCGALGNSSNNNCRIWLAYYSNRIRALKSSMSLAFFTPEGKKLLKKLRVGYEDYHESFTPSNNWQLKPMYDVDNQVGTDNQKALHNWIFGVQPTLARTPLKAAISLVERIQAVSKTNNSGNPFLVNPARAYEAKTNEKKMCRRNAMLMLTDGQWDIWYAGDTDPYGADNLSSTYPEISSVRVTNDYALNDGKTYSGTLTPYANNRNRLIDNLPSGETQNDFPVMADVALAAWKEDMDGDSSTDILEPKWYEDTDGNTPELAVASGSSEEKKYWHPLNDPAKWQHINTYTMGFNVKIGQCADTNKPWCSTGVNGGVADWGVNTIPTIANLTDFNNYLSISDAQSFDVENFTGISRILNVSKDLANAAMVGRGRYYQVEEPGELIKGFQDLLNQTGETVTIAAKTGSSGVAGNSKNAGNSYFSSRYDAAVFNGELMKYKLFDGSSSNAIACFGSVPSPLPVAGTACSAPTWNVGKTLSPITWDSRDVITAKVDGTSHSIVDFDEDAISATQKATLKDNFPVVLSSNFADDEARYEKLFNYVKGDSEQEASGIFRSRDGYEFVDGSTGRNIFGAIVRSSPVFAGLPTAFTSHLDKSKIAYKKYVQFLSDYKTANMGGVSEVIYVAANDGMLHAISANSGDVKFSYVPNAVYEHLPNTVVPEQQVSLNDGNIDVQLVNFGSDVTDDNNNKDWQRVLVGSMGGGAKGLYALNVTDPSAIKIKTATKGNWEFSDDDMGNIMAQPAIIQLQDNTWAAVVGNGYNSKNNKAALFVINLETGELIQKLEMPSSFSDSSKPNGLGPLFFAAYPDKGVNKRNYYDRAYAGDLQGNLWVFDLTKVKNNTDATDKISVVHNKPLFTADHTDSTGVTAKQPITVAPKVVKHPMGYGYLVHFGTGALFERNDLSSGITNSVYGIWDDWVAKEHGGLPETTLLPSDTVTNTELNPIKLKTATITVEGNDVDLRYLDNSNINTSWKLPGKGGVHRGWRVDLLKGERAWQPAQTAYGSGNSEVMSYNTVRYVDKTSQSDCVDDGSGVTSWQLVFNPEDFARNLSAQGALDINKDGKYDKGDVLNADDTPRLSEVDSLGNVKTIIPIGEITVDSINYNSSDQDIEQSGVTQSGCRLNRQTKSNSSSGTTGVTVQRCAYFSSWKELK